MEKILSIIIPTYNMEELLPQCLNSLIIHNRSDALDVIIVNDGSKDASSSIAHKYANNNPETFRVIDKENGNYGSCVNRGLKEAKGKYIKILDADDYFDTTVLSIFLKELASTNSDIVFSDFVKVDDKGNRRMYYSYSNFPHKKIFPTSTIPFHINIWMHAVAYRTQLLRDIHYYQSEGISYTDQEWIFLPFNACEKAYYVNVCLYHYLVGRNGQTMDPTVFARNISQEVTGTFKMLKEWQQLKAEERKSEDYMKYRILNRCKEIYKSAFFYGGYKYFDLRQFEKDLKLISKEIHDDCNNFVLCAHRFTPRMKLVKKWRECGNMVKIQHNYHMIWTKTVLFLKKHLSLGLFKSKKMMRMDAV